MNSVKLDTDIHLKSLSLTMKNCLGLPCKEPVFFSGVIHQIYTVVEVPWKQWEISMVPIVESELNGPIAIKLDERNVFSAAQIDQLTKTIKTSRDSNPYFLLESVMEMMMQTLPNSLPSIDPQRTFPTRVFIQIYWQELLMAWHQAFFAILMRETARKFNDKLQLGKGFHNFTQLEIPQATLNILEKGPKFIPSQRPDLTSSQKLFQEKVQDFARWAGHLFRDYRFKSMDDWPSLEHFLLYLTHDSTHPLHLFWVSIYSDFVSYKNRIEVDLVPADGNVTFVNHQELVNSILQPGIICATADKNYGLVLLPIEVVTKGEEKMICKLGAMLENTASKESILSKIWEEEKGLRTGDNSQIVQLLKRFPPIDKPQMPFLRLAPKIQKLSLQQVKDKDTDSLTFRPICDSEFYTTRPCAQALASLLISLKLDVIRLFPAMEKFYPLDSNDVAKKMKNLSFPPKNPFSLIVSCDMGDAYSNCTLEDLLVSSDFLCKVVGYDPCIYEMIKSLGSFVLNNNLIEIGGKIYRCKPVLPMGCCLSGDALDIILMPGELMVFINPHLNDESIVSLPHYMPDQRDKLDVIDYERYRDDTKIIMSADHPLHIINSMTTFTKTMFPPRIPISFEYSIFTQSFLGCCFFIHFAGRSFSTFPRLNFTRPSIGTHISSNSFLGHLISGYTTNAITYSRLCSDSRMLELVINCLKQEMILAEIPGHAISMWYGFILNRIDDIRKRDTESTDNLCMGSIYDLLHGLETLPDFTYPPSSPFDRYSNVNSLYSGLSARALKLLNTRYKRYTRFMGSIKPSRSLKSILVTKGNYRKQIKAIEDITS